MSTKFRLHYCLARIVSTFHVDVRTFMTEYLQILLVMRNVADKVVETIKVHIIYSTFLKNLAVYKIN